MKRAAAGAHSRGFSLVEVMVAVIVICVGMLGIAKMEALSVSNTTTARLRSPRRCTPIDSIGPTPLFPSISR